MAKIKVSGFCVFCGSEYRVEVEPADLEKYDSGALAQEAFPSPKYSIEDREFMISQICPNCQSKIFG